MEESWELLEIEMNLIDTSLEEGPKLIVDDKSQEEKDHGRNRWDRWNRWN